ncbi:ABC transporter permease [Verrucomicrobiota bacterium]
MRSKAGILVANLYVLVLSAYMIVIYHSEGGFDDTLGSVIGSSICRLISFTQLWIIIVVCPLITASTITSEREQKTFDSLFAAPVSIGRVVAAKLLAAMGYFFALLFISLPLMSLSFILGGVSPTTIAEAYTVTFCHTIFVGAIGFYWSTRFQRSIAAIPAASITVLTVSIIPMVFDEMGDSFLSTISSIVSLAAIHTGNTISFLGESCPAWVPGTILAVLLAIYLIRASVVRLHFAPERYYVFLRFMFLLILLAVFTFIVGKNFGEESEHPTIADIRSIFSLISFSTIILAPWLGANRTVADSDKTKPARTGFVRFLRTMFLSAPGFLILLALGGAAVLTVGLQFNKQILPVSIPLIWLAFFGVITLSAVTWSLLAQFLTNRATRKGYWIALVITYILVIVVTVVPSILEGALKNEETMVSPPAIQFLATISPGFATERVQAGKFFARNYPSLMRLTKPVDPLFITTGLYAILTTALALLVIRKKRKCQKK